MRPRIAAFAACLGLLSPGFLAAEDIDPAAERLIDELGLIESETPVNSRPGWKPPRRIVVIGADAERIEWLEQAVPGVELVAAPSRADAVREAGDADAVIGGCVPEVVAAGPKIRWIQHFTAGVERCLAIPDIRARNIVLTNMQKVAGAVMSEHVLAFLFGLTRGLATFVPLQARGEWRDEAVPESRMWSVEGRTMLVLGLGGIGTEVARRAHALGMKVIATRNSSREGPPYVSEVGLPGDLLAFAGRADVIVNTLPLTDETRGLIDKSFFDSARRGALFINVGRGATVVTGDLVAALRDGRIGGAGLDVTDPEPLPPEHPLWRMPNVVITPHVAASIDTGDEPRWMIARENLRRYVGGGKLLSEVDLRRGY